MTTLVPIEGSQASGFIEYDFPRIKIGTAEYAEGPTGTTVIEVEHGGRTAVDRRGGAIGMSGGFPFSHAICLTGGSTFGLAAGTGVTDEMLKRSGNSTRFDSLPAVSTAVIYDFGPRDNAIYPDAELGRAALNAAVHGKAQYGRVGAGVSATVGKVAPGRAEFAGQGIGFQQIGDIKLLVVTVVNAIGVIVDRDGTIVRGNYDAQSGTRRHPSADYANALSLDQVPESESGNTTITAVVTNVQLNDRDLGQFARQVHSSMHRAIQPFHTGMDGDVLFAVTTDEVALPPAAPAVGHVALGVVASEVAWDAVLRSVSTSG